jgi:hypothetical protein
MDQDFNGSGGETPGDQFVLQFGVQGPRIIASTPSGNVSVTPVSSLRVTFNEPIDPTTFDPSKIPSFTGPGGPITVSGVSPVDGSGNTQFDITFPGQTVLGNYTMVIGPHIQDFFGNEMDQNDNLIPGEPGVSPAGDQFAATFKIVPRYAAEAIAFENNVLHPGDAGVVPMPFLGPTDTGDPFYADENFGIINLGANTFNFFGTTYTGNNHLFVDSEGMINFDGTESPNDFQNTDLTDSPPEPTIAALWTDYIKLPSDPGGPEVLYKFDTANNRLIVEWNQTKIFPSTPKGVTFQAILQLNTGTNAGDITYNYIDLNNGSFDTRLATTTGIKDGGTQTGDGRVLVSFNQANPLIGSGQAIRIHQV